MTDRKPRPAYWRVDMSVYAFESKAAAEAFSRALIDRFCAMPESEVYASSTRVVGCDEDGNEIQSNT